MIKRIYSYTLENYSSLSKGIHIDNIHKNVKLGLSTFLKTFLQLC